MSELFIQEDYNQEKFIKELINLYYEGKKLQESIEILADKLPKETKEKVIERLKYIFIK